MQPDPVHSPSVVVGQYQKLRVLVPVEGTVTVWLSQLSPSGSVPVEVPSSAEPEPLCARTVLPVGSTTPPVLQDVRPVSKPPFCTRIGLVEGVTGFDGAEAGPVPMALVALTVKVYVVPLVSPVMVLLVAGGFPVTVVGVCAVLPMYGVTV